MEPTNELNELLKRSMQFDANELPEPNPDIQRELRKKAESKKAIAGKGFLSQLLQFLSMDIKLYHAGIAIAGVCLVFIVFRHSSSQPAQFRQVIMVADTNSGSSLKDDTFLVRNFSKTIN